MSYKNIFISLVFFSFMSSVLMVAPMDVNLGSLLSGASVNHENLETLFLNACESGELAEVKKFLELGVDKNVRDSKSGYSGRHYAARNGHMHILELLSQDNDVEDRSLVGFTPMHLAALHHHLNVVAWYVERGADVNSCDADGLTCLHMAARVNAEDIVKYLLSIKSINVNPRCSGGDLPSLLAAKHGNLGVLKLLLAHGASLDAISGRGANLLYLAVEPKKKPLNASSKEIAFIEQQTVDMVKFLMNTGKFDPGALVTIQDSVSGKSSTTTILGLSAEGGIAQVGKILLGHPGFNISSNAQQAAFLNACNFGKLDFAKILLDRKQFDINGFVVKDTNLTCLHMTAVLGKVNVIEFLLQNGADYTIKSLDGKIAEQIALDYKQDDVAHYLKKVAESKKAEQELLALWDVKDTPKKSTKSNKNKKNKAQSLSLQAMTDESKKLTSIKGQDSGEDLSAKKLIKRVTSFKDVIEDAIDKISPPSSPKKSSPVKNVAPVQSLVVIRNNRAEYKKSSIFLYENKTAGTYVADPTDQKVFIPVPEILDNVGSRLAENHYKTAQYSLHVKTKRESKDDIFHNFPDSVEKNNGHWFHTVVTDFRLHPAAKAYWEKQLGTNEVENCWFELKSTTPARINQGRYPAEKAERLGPNGYIEGVILATGLSKDDQKTVVHLCFRKDN